LTFTDPMSILSEGSLMMKAILLAGGKGTRLAPYTTVLPKPLLPIGDKPILEIVVRQLASYRFTNITLAVGYLAELLMAYFGDGQKFGVRLAYSREENPLGTAGPIALIPNSGETFLVMNGDLLTNIDYEAMWKYHRQHGAIATVASRPREVKIDLGVLETSEDGWVKAYIEKPTYHYEVSTGIYMFEPEIYNYLGPGERMDLPQLIVKLLEAGRQVAVYRFDGYWLDIGRPDDYELASHEFSMNPQKFLKDV
jgi:NDP-sugar pyrophosphorylase family protein